MSGWKNDWREYILGVKNNGREYVREGIFLLLYPVKTRVYMESVYLMIINTSMI